jgi:hypothetical protein
VSQRYATLLECKTVYGLKDIYDMMEIILVDAHNRREMNKRPTDQRSG